MRKTLLFLALCLTLVGCGSTVRTRLTFDVTNSAKRTELLEASERVMERRLSRLTNSKPPDFTVEQESGSVLLSFTIEDADVRKQLKEELLSPFSLKLMLLSENGGDLFVEEQGWFKETGLTEKSISWTVAGKDPDGKGNVTLEFSPEGRPILDKVFQDHVNGTLGLFVRNRLMAKMLIGKEKPKEKIVIGGIPSPDIAGIFTDDVNTGTHVRFSLP